MWSGGVCEAWDHANSACVLWRKLFVWILLVGCLYIHSDRSLVLEGRVFLFRSYHYQEFLNAGLNNPKYSADFALSIKEVGKHGIDCI
jgi:hypothetical protein